MARRAGGSAPVCVLGDVDLVRALGLAGLRSVVVADPDDPVRFSRHTAGMLPRLDHWTQASAMVDQLVAWADTQPEPPVLIPQTDGDLLLVSRNRDRLAGRFRFLVPPAPLVEDLLDKGRFQRLAQRADIPIPPGRVLTSAAPADVRGLRFPLVVKPLLRRDLARLGVLGKAVVVDGEAALALLWPTLAADGVEVLLQELIPGPETRVESWHAYIDEWGRVVGEFCGAKVRTYPPEYGHSTAVRVTDIPDVRQAGRDVGSRLQVRGLVKVDFKRDPAGALHLLEVNPRATLWLHPGAVAGVNLAAMLYADLTGRPRPHVRGLRRDVLWCAPREDRWAVRAAGVPRLTWLADVLRSRARSGAAWTDPAPLLRGQLAPAISKRLRSRRHTPDQTS